MFALKYRPKKLAEVKGQETTVETLKNSLKTNRLPHAIVLSGIRGIGKTTLARIIGKALNCENLQDGDACLECASCKAFEQDAHLDIIEIDAASHTGVDNMRELIQSSQYKAVTGKSKVFIIDEAHMLSKSAFNALLKTLEEPPAHTYFILATTEIHKIPATILSRCMHLNLSPFSALQIQEHLERVLKQEGIPFEPDALNEIVMASSGSMRDALTLLNQIVIFNQNVSKESVHNVVSLTSEDQILTVLDLLFQGNVEGALEIVHKNTKDTTVFLQQIMDAMYSLICEKQNIRTGLIHKELVEKIKEHLDLPTLFQIWHLLHDGYQELVESPLKSQTLDMILMRIVYVDDFVKKKA
ncbi:MAG: DNA polymerase III subunit gamma/tau [Alphaproteobacteria bacterium]|nr:MAG: DNA polymerase III subunit gamma/tau [Alphaproteobacteria bacterium]